MEIFRVNKNDTDGYTIIINKMLQDKDLSLEAKGLLSMILTLPKDWDYTVKGLAIISNEKDGKYAVVLGNEVFGVDDSVLALCDGAIEIPQVGTKHSLNVSVAAGILIYETVKQRNNEN